MVALKWPSRFGLHSPSQAGMLFLCSDTVTSAERRQWKLLMTDHKVNGQQGQVTPWGCNWGLFKAVDTVLLWRVMHFVFLWLCIIWNPFPWTALGSARRLEFIPAIPPSPFSYCITVHQWPFFSASISLLTFCQLAHWGKKPQNKNPKTNKHWSLRHEAVWNYSHCSNSQTHTSKRVRNAPNTLSFPFMPHEHIVKVVNILDFLVVFTQYNSMCIGRTPSTEDETV